MSKATKTINRVPGTELIDIALENGLDVETMSAYHKCTDQSGGPCRIYIATSKNVARVHLTFQFINKGVKLITPEDAKLLRMGTVRAELDFSYSKEETLDTFQSACHIMKDLNQLIVEKEKVKNVA